VDGLSLVLGVASVLLVVAGGAKLAVPKPTAVALAGVGRATPDGGVRAIGAVEIALGLAAALTGSAPIVTLVAATYVGFAGFVVAAWRRDSPSCGCFGTAGARPGWPHLIVDLALAIGSAGAALTGARSVRAVVADEPSSIGLVGVAALICYLALTRGDSDAGAPVLASALATVQALPNAPSGRLDDSVAVVGGVDLRAGATALVFLSTTCLTCREIWQGLGLERLPGGVRAIIVTDDDERAGAVAALAPPRVTTVADSGAWTSFGVTAAPAVVVVVDGEVIAAALTGSWAAAVTLIAKASATAPH